MRAFTEKNAGSGADLKRLHHRAQRLLAESGVDPDCHVSIHRQDRWYVFQGRVSCSGTKAALFSLVPSEGGAQRIIDRVHVGRTGPDIPSVH